jgi:hypothetical protein
MTDPTDLDAALADIEAREAERAAKRKSLNTEPGDAMCKAINIAIARAERAHRLATEHVEIKSYECS